MLRFTITFILLTYFSCLAHAQGEHDIDTTFQNGFRIYFEENAIDDYDDSLSISYKGKVLFKEENSYISIGIPAINEFGNFKRDSIIGDFNKNGKADLVFTSTAGGSAGIADFYFLEFGAKSIKVLYQQKDIVRLRIYENDRFPVISYLDDVLAYWNTCGACSPYVEVFKKWSIESSSFEYVAPIKKVTFRYKNEPRDIDYINNNMTSILYELWDNRAWCEDRKDGTQTTVHLSKVDDYWSIITFLLNAGETKQAISFSKLAWNASVDQRRVFLKSYIDKLKTSKDYAYLNILNKNIEKLIE